MLNKLAAARSFSGHNLPDDIRQAQQERRFHQAFIQSGGHVPFLNLLLEIDARQALSKIDRVKQFVPQDQKSDAQRSKAHGNQTVIEDRITLHQGNGKDKHGVSFYEKKWGTNRLRLPVISD